MSKFQNSKDAKDVLELKKPIDVLFEGGNLDVYKTIKKFQNKELYNSINSMPEDFAYLVVGHWMHGNYGHDRKNIAFTIKSFYETFKNKENPPALILKTSRVNSSIVDKELIQKKINELRNGVGGKNIPSVYLLHGEFTDKEMNWLHNKTIFNNPEALPLVNRQDIPVVSVPIVNLSLTTAIVNRPWADYLVCAIFSKNAKKI